MSEQPVAPADAPAPTDDTTEPAAGHPFTMPQIFAEDVPTVDGRMADLGAVEFRDCPLPVMAMFTADHGSEAGPSVFVGNLADVARSDAGVWSGTGAFDDFDANDDAAECARLVASGRLNGVSVDLAVEEYRFEITGIDDEGMPTGEMFVVTKGTVVGVTVVPMPAQTGCAIDCDMPAGMGDGDGDETTPAVAASLPVVGWNLIVPDGCLPCADRATDTVTAAGGPVAPPSGWFTDPGLDGPTPLTVTDDGRVYGHLATWSVCHVGIGNACVTAPKSASDYAFFRTGLIRTAEGDDVPVGQVTLAGGHADLSLGARAAVAHYDDTQSAVVDVAVGEDTHGIWLAGALRPGVSDEQLRTLRASGISGDWRPIRGRLELVAACSVNTPGFPVVRARVAAGSTVALIAAGPTAAPDTTSVSSATVAALLSPETVAELEAWRREREADRLLARLAAD